MATDPSAQPPAPKAQLRLASGEVIFARWPNIALEGGMLCHRLWLRGALGALQVAECPPGWNGETNWWLPEGAEGAEGEGRAGLLSLLPDLMRWLPPSVDAPGKLQVAERMPFPERPFGSGGWDENDPAVRPFVDAVFVDDAAHLHLVDVVSLRGGDALRKFVAWKDSLSLRRLERHWLHPGDPGSRFHAEYCKLCWTRRQSPVDGVCSLIDSRGDEIPHRTVEAFWRWVGRRCAAYWDENLPYEQRCGPRNILVTDADMPPDERLFACSLYGNFTLACVTPFVLDGATWVRVDVREWADTLGEPASLAANRVCRMVGATDVGKRRTANQDAVLWSEEDGWAAVADGMGGHPHGDVASATVLRVFQDAMRQWPDGPAPHRRGTVAQRLRRAAADAHVELWKKNEGKGIFERMGTTLCALRLHGDELSIVHAGDSRIYEFACGVGDREPHLRRLTEDHGERGGLDRALGLWERMPFDMDTVRIGGDALYLLCTDGLTNMVSDRAIRALCLKHRASGGAATDLRGLVNALIDAANEAGGDDNITVCAVEAKERREQPAR